MSDSDIKLLKLINSDGALLKTADFRRYDFASDFRLSRLEQSGFIQKHTSKDENYAGDYEITGKGYAFISDFDLAIRKSKSARFRELLSNIYIPLIVSVVFNLIMALLES